MEQMQNAYVGIGVTISSKIGDEGIEIQQVDPTGGAYEAGVQAGDILVEVEKQKLTEIGLDGASALIRGEENTQVEITVLRGEERLTFSVTRRKIQVTVATGQMLEDKIGLVTIANFDERCADETLAAVKTLVEQGAQALIFDVRFNPGGYKQELVKVLDYLLPEGPIFRSESYDGKESVTESDASCLELPMAVLVNGDSYSAAEFFAAALNEYDRAVVIGEPTVGKSYFQTTFELNDGSAVGLSIGKYYTPNGVSLADEGGLKPEIQLDMDEETEKKLYAGKLTPEEDPHVQAAITALKEAN
jgi:carboxyl-terminal processing protease